ncbi:enolase superfamily enzyme related to L-alanine-DL-glutamate epimerase [Hoeflea sp. IMCC20628]|uniref:N-acetyl-D-Glu racemase DgcA n=1 Tax=Hoeflea sp. IMCC20628 TaxID=1620421 RepID=UPI00063AEAE5|nr:N-acetyl-D-Glu racemase DgcA [Hoeflea sp. IMCC20628]AKI00262.1 enolase superfamily enzyme related to L-alanine-DL-glutamate epimerase [Hoeflea sp. IMCC20628]
MPRQLHAKIDSFPLTRAFTISRGAKTSAEVVTCTISDNGVSGHGECVPYARYGETVEGVMEAIKAFNDAIASGMSREELQSAMAAGAARNAIDCALWDLEAKLSGTRVSTTACRILPRPVPTAVTISLGEPADMADQARAHTSQKLLKVKVGTSDDRARMHAVASAAPDAEIILDANEGWDESNIREHLLLAAELHIGLIEQPMPAGKDEILAHIPHPVPICADESVHTLADLESLSDRYDAINIKLDKTGGLTEALRMRDRARELGFGVMIGCMVGSSLAMAPAVLLAQDADWVDLDGPLLLARDRSPGLVYTGSLVSPPSAELWG